jgi:hypothetical protein
MCDIPCDNVLRDHHAEISALCLNHLRREEAVLLGKRDTLHNIHAALVRGNLDTMESLQQRQQEAVRTSDDSRHEREQFRNRIGTLLQLPPESVTISRVVAALPEAEREPLRVVWSRLLELAAEVDKLNGDIAALIDYCLGFTRRYLLDITGGGRPAEGYGPAGTHLDASAGSFLHARG